MANVRAYALLVSFFALAGCLLTGCVFPLAQPPPAMSFGKSLGMGGEEDGTVWAGAGGVLYVSDSDTSFYLPVAEGGATFRLGRSYALAIGLGTMNASVDGRIAVVNSGVFKLGVTHGVGGALFADVRDRSSDVPRGWWAMLDLSGGLLAEMAVWEKLTPFAGLRYVYARSFKEWSANETGDGVSPAEGVAQYGIGGIGVRIQLGGMAVIPEVVVCRASWAGRVSNDVWLLVGGVGLSADF